MYSTGSIYLSFFGVSDQKHVYMDVIITGYVNAWASSLTFIKLNFLICKRMGVIYVKQHRIKHSVRA